MPTIAAIVLVLAGSAIAGSGQVAASLAPLTVPSSALPAGCVLEPIANPPGAAAQGGSSRLWPGTGPGFPANPWAGTDARLVTAVGQAIDPDPVAKPDGQIVALSAASVSRTRDEGVLEAYRAVYVASDGSRTHVAAVRFSDAAFVRPEPVSAMTDPPRGLSRRFVRDATVVRVSATTPDACTRAIVAHVQAAM